MATFDYRKFYYDEIAGSLHQFYVGFSTLLVMASLAVIWIIKTFTNKEIFDFYLNDILLAGTVEFLLCLLCWFFLFKKISPFRESEGGIVIAFNKQDEKVNGELEKLYSKIVFLVAQKSIEFPVKVKLAPKWLTPQNQKEAYRARERFNAKLIIWGNVEYGNLNSDPHTIFIPISFSYKVKLPPKNALIINQGFEKLLSDKKWIINESQNLIDRNYLANNLTEISLYIIGIVIFFSGKKNVAYDILKEVYVGYKSKPLISSDDVIAIRNLQIILDNIIREETKDLQLWSGSKTKDLSIQKALHISGKCKEVDFEGNALLLESQVEFAKNNLNKAKSLVKQALEVTNNDAGVQFSLAFLNYYEGNLEQGWLYFNRALKSKLTNYLYDQVITIAIWYEKAIEEDQNKKYLNFPLGILYCDLMKDEKLTKETFNKLSDYLKETASVKATKIMDYEVSKRLKKLRKLKR
jgi:hypothetical protein